jgi:hypothetical protein
LIYQPLRVQSAEKSGSSFVLSQRLKRQVAFSECVAIRSN